MTITSDNRVTTGSNLNNNKSVAEGYGSVILHD